MATTLFNTSSRAGAVPSSARTPLQPPHRLKRLPSGPRRSQGFTLVEATIAGVVIAALTTGLLMTLRYSQLMSQGKAAGEQLNTISAGVSRYMKQNAQKILALDRNCAELTLEIKEGSSADPIDPTAGHDCSLALGDVTVRNGYQPTVEELRRLDFVRASEDLLLPYTDGVVQDKSARNDPNAPNGARPRVAVWIQPVVTSSSSGSGRVARSTPALMQLAASPPARAASGTRAAMDMPPTINGVSCYDGQVLIEDGSMSVTGTPVFYDAATPDFKPLPIYSEAAITQALEEHKTHALNGQAYCRMMQKKGFGVFGPSGSTQPGTGTPGTPDTTHSWTLESVVFNTQPYYFGQDRLQMGAAAQAGAALEATGYAGRLSALKANDQDNGKTLRGLYGGSSMANPILSRDGQRGVRGILAVVNLLGDTEQVAAGGGSSGDSNMSWDANGNNLTNASLVQGAQIAGATAVVGIGESMPTRGRTAVMAVNGDMVMGNRSTLMANVVEGERMDAAAMNAQRASVRELNLSGTSFKMGLGASTDAQKFTLYMGNAANVRLPRAKPGDPCDTYSDIGMSRAVSIQPLALLGNPVVTTRFLLHCVPTRPATLTQRGPSIWASSDYDALIAKYPTSTYGWFWYDSSAADHDDPGLVPF